MNPFYNPSFLSWLLKTYISEIDRLRKLDEKALRKYQGKCLKNMVKFAYSVPLYHEKYKKAGIHPTDINGLNDIEKLPIISKFDFKNISQESIISSKIPKDDLSVDHVSSQ